MSVKKLAGRPKGYVSRHEVLAKELALRAQREWAFEQRLPSYRQLAEEYGMGVKTVRLAVKSLEQEGLLVTTPRKRTTRISGVGSAAVMAQGIALVLSTDVQTLFDSQGIRQEILKEIVRNAASIGCPLIFLQHYRRWRTEIPWGLNGFNLSGVLLLGPFREEILHQYQRFHCPVVVLDQPTDADISCVCGANHAAAMDAVGRMIAHGHSRLAFVRSIVPSLNNIDPDARQRQAGFLSACEQARLPASNYKIWSTGFRYMSKTVHEMVHADPPFTGILCSSAAHAAQVTRAARAAGRRIPADLSIVSFQSGEPNEFTGPQLNGRLVASAAFRLLEKFEGKIRRIQIPFQWNEGKTLARPRGRRC